VKVGDLVARTYGEGQRPMAIIVGWWQPAGRTNALPIAEVIWLGADRIVQFGAEYLEVISANR